jgi:hypothetical protein
MISTSPSSATGSRLDRASISASRVLKVSMSRAWSALPLARDDEIGIDADRGVVDENLAIGLGEVDHPHVALGDRLGRRLDVQGDAHIPGK